MALLSGGQSASLSSVVSALNKAGIKTDSGKAVSVPKTSGGGSSGILSGGKTSDLNTVASTLNTAGIATPNWNPSTGLNQTGLDLLKQYNTTNLADIQDISYNPPVDYKADITNPFTSAYNFSMGAMTDVGASGMQGQDGKEKSMMDYFGEAYAPDEGF
jgi:hypothetical protein